MIKTKNPGEGQLLYTRIVIGLMAIGLIYARLLGNKTNTTRDFWLLTPEVAEAQTVEGSIKSEQVTIKRFYRKLVDDSRRLFRWERNLERASESPSS